jgi:hypothetical protein
VTASSIPSRCARAGTPEDAFASAASLASAAEAADCKRFRVELAQIGNATRTIRIGAGGIWLLDHTPFQTRSSSARSRRCLPAASTSGLAVRPERAEFLASSQLQAMARAIVWAALDPVPRQARDERMS